MTKKEFICGQLDAFSNSTLILFGIYIVTTIAGLIRLSLKKK